MLDGKEGRVEDDADRDGRLEQRVVDHFEQEVLKLEPTAVADAAASASGAIAVLCCFWN